MMPKIAIPYKTVQEMCHCCEQFLPEPRISREKIFFLQIEDFKEWTDDWEYCTDDNYDLKEIIFEFIWEVIRENSEDTEEYITIDDEDIDKAIEFVKSNLRK